MTEPAPSAGVHLPWAQVPERVQAWAGGLGRGSVERVSDLEGGFSPGATSRLHFSQGADLFVKAVGLDLNPESPILHRREGVVASVLPTLPFLPRFIDAYDDGDWVALAFEAIDGRLPRRPWEQAELSAAVEALVSMHDALTPSPSSVIPPAAERFAPLFECWRLLAGTPIPPDGLDAWSTRHLDQLAELESGWTAASVGTTLLHGDLRSDNMLVTADGRIVVIDWPHAAVGAPILDVVCWAPSVVLEDGPLPEELLASHQAWRQFDQDAVAVLVAAVAGFFIEHSLRPAPPGLPTLRAFQAAQGEVTRAWLERLTGWSR